MKVEELSFVEVMQQLTKLNRGINMLLELLEKSTSESERNAYLLECVEYCKMGFKLLAIWLSAALKDGRVKVD